MRRPLPSRARPVGTHNRQTAHHPEVAHMLDRVCNCVRQDGGCNQSIRQEESMTETILYACAEFAPPGGVLTPSRDTSGVQRGPREGNQRRCLTRTRCRSRAGQFSRSFGIEDSEAEVGRIRSMSILVSSVLRWTPKLLAASVWFQPCFSRVCRI